MALKLLFLQSAAPYHDFRVQETLDAILTAGALEQEVAVLYMADGVYQLLNHQESSLLRQRPPNTAINTLHLYDVKDVYVSESSLRTRGLLASDIADGFDPAQIITDAEMQKLLHQQDRIFSL